MFKRIDRSWLVFVSVENPEHDRRVDFFSRPDGSYGFEEFRRDVEDGYISRETARNLYGFEERVAG